MLASQRDKANSRRKENLNIYGLSGQPFRATRAKPLFRGDGVCLSALISLTPGPYSIYSPLASLFSTNFKKSSLTSLIRSLLPFPSLMSSSTFSCFSFSSSIASRNSFKTLALTIMPRIKVFMFLISAFRLKAQVSIIRIVKSYDCLKVVKAMLIILLIFLES